MEIIAQNTAVYGKGCYGCNKHDRQIMVAVMEESPSTEIAKIHDVFLTEEQAELLITQLRERLDQNAE